MIPKIEHIDSFIQIAGAGVAALLLRWGSQAIRRKQTEPVALSSQNIAWAKEMMTRLENENRDLKNRMDALENEVDAWRTKWEECERRHVIVEINLKRLLEERSHGKTEATT